MKADYSDSRHYWTRERIVEWFDRKGHMFTYPAIYLGDEINSAVSEDPYPANGQAHVCLVTPATYAGVAGNIGIEVLYALFKLQTDAQVERCYFSENPKDDMVLEKEGVPYFSVEHKFPLSAFDILAFTVTSVGFDLNNARMIHACGIPVMSCERSEDDPIIIRGGADSYSVDSVVEWYDALFIGDVEVPAGIQGLRVLMDLTKPKAERLEELARTVPGWYVPALYREVYDAQDRIAGWEPLVDGIPEKVSRQFIKDLNGSFHVEAPLMTYIEQGYSEATFLISRGCVNHCAFCTETFTWAPYRELSKENALEVARKMYKNTGSTKIIPVAFCSSTYSERKALLAELYMTVSDTIKLISQRVDEMAADPDFVDMSAQLGNTTVALGVEGSSQRLRDAMGKNCTEEQILKATELACRAGYRRVKYYLIANLPGETEEDLAEMVELARKIHQLIRVDLQSSMDVKWSWTPLMIQPFAPLSWTKPNLSEKRSLEHVLPAIKELGFSVRVGPAGRTGHRVVAHICTLGDRRAARPLLDLVIDHDARIWWAFGRKLGDVVPGVFAKYGLDPDALWLREHDYEENMPWDFIDNHIKKSWLWELHEKYFKGITTPKCTVKCTSCGACDSESLKMMKDFRKREKVDHSFNVRNLVPVTQRRVVSRARLKVEIDRKHRFVQPGYWKYAIRRAASMSDHPIHKKYSPSLSDVIKYRGWIFGVDYMDIGLADFYDADELKDVFNEYLRGIRILDVKVYGSDLKQVSSQSKAVWYRMQLDKDVSTAQKKIDWFMASSEVVIKKRFPIMRKGWFLKDTDIRGNVLDAFLTNQGHSLYIDFVISGDLTPAEFYRALYGSTEQRVFRLGVERMAGIAELAEFGQEDFFRTACPECKRLVEVDLMGSPVGVYCIRHSFAKPSLNLAKPPSPPFTPLFLPEPLTSPVLS